MSAGAPVKPAAASRPVVVEGGVGHRDRVPVVVDASARTGRYVAAYRAAFDCHRAPIVPDATALLCLVADEGRILDGHRATVVEDSATVARRYVAA